MGWRLTGNGMLQRSDAVEDLSVDGLVGCDVGEEHSCATANHCLATAGQIVDEADAWSELVIVVTRRSQQDRC